MRLDDCGQSLLGDGQEGVSRSSSFDSIHSDVNGAVLLVSNLAFYKEQEMLYSAVLESNAHGECRSQFSVDLRLGGSGSDSSP